MIIATIILSILSFLFLLLFLIFCMGGLVAEESDPDERVLCLIGLFGTGILIATIILLAIK